MLVLLLKWNVFHHHATYRKKKRATAESWLVRLKVQRAPDHPSSLLHLRPRLRAASRGGWVSVSALLRPVISILTRDSRDSSPLMWGHGGGAETLRHVGKLSACSATISQTDIFCVWKLLICAVTVTGHCQVSVLQSEVQYLPLEQMLLTILLYFYFSGTFTCSGVFFFFYQYFYFSKRIWILPLLQNITINQW